MCGEVSVELLGAWYFPPVKALLGSTCAVWSSRAFEDIVLPVSELCGISKSHTLPHATEQQVSALAWECTSEHRKSRA